MPWEYLPETKDDNAALRKPDGGYEAVFYEGDAPDKATGDMWAEALNVHEATGLTPSQLQARVVELEAYKTRADLAISGLAKRRDNLKARARTAEARVAELEADLRGWVDYDRQKRAAVGKSLNYSDDMIWSWPQLEHSIERMTERDQGRTTVSDIGLAYLQPDDFENLQRVSDMFSDVGEFSLPAPSTERLVSIGCLRKVRGRVYEITTFGKYVLSEAKLPLQIGVGA